jgi:hypothetical protein
VLLDAAAFVPTNRLDLAAVHPDFVALSFYKMFGYPTGVGALIARRDGARKLHRPWFAGGTITVASVQADRSPRAGCGRLRGRHPRLRGLPASTTASTSWSGRHRDVHGRVELPDRLAARELTALRHGNGAPLVRSTARPWTEAAAARWRSTSTTPDGR